MPENFNFVFNAIDMVPALAKPAKYNGKECPFSELVLYYAIDSADEAIITFFKKAMNGPAYSLVAEEIYAAYEAKFHDPQFVQAVTKIILCARYHAIHSVWDQLNTIENIKKGLTTVQSSLNGLFLIITLLRDHDCPSFQSILSETTPHLVSDIYCILYNISGAFDCGYLDKDDEDLRSHFESSMLYAEFMDPYYTKCQAKHMAPEVGEKMVLIQSYRHIAIAKYYMALKEYDKASQALIDFSPSLEKRLPKIAYVTFSQEKKDLETKLHQVHSPLASIEEEQARLHAEILAVKDHIQQSKKAEKREKAALKTAIATLKQSNGKLKERCTATQMAIGTELAKYTAQIETLTNSIEDLKKALKDQPSKTHPPQCPNDSVAKQIADLKAKKTKQLAAQKQLEQQTQSLDAQIAEAQRKATQQEQARKTHLLQQAIKPEALESLSKKLEELRTENGRLHTANLSLQGTVQALEKEIRVTVYHAKLAYADLNRHIRGFCQVALDVQQAQAQLLASSPPILYQPMPSPLPMQGGLPPTTYTVSTQRGYDAKGF